MQFQKIKNTFMYFVREKKNLSPTAAGGALYYSAIITLWTLFLSQLYVPIKVHVLCKHQLTKFYGVKKKKKRMTLLFYRLLNIIESISRFIGLCLMCLPVVCRYVEYNPARLSQQKKEAHFQFKR